MTMVSKRLGSGDNSGNLTAREGRRRWRLSGWGLETMLDTWRLWSGDDIQDLVDGGWRRRWNLSGWGLETILETAVE